MDFRKAMESKKVLICDGAMGTELQKLGIGRGIAPDTWNITHPDQVKDVHKSYIEAGAQVIQGNTGDFGAV